MRSPGEGSVAAVGELSAAVVSRLADERWLVALVVFHTIGVHWLAAARSWWSKAPATLLLAAAAGCWIKSTMLSQKELGANAPTAGAAAGLVILAGLWLTLAGKSPREWLAGFGFAVLGAVGLLLVSGQRWPAVACATLAAPLVGASIWFSSRQAESQPRSAPVMDQLVSALAVLLIAVVLAIAMSRSGPMDTTTSDTPRLRDLLSQPATALLLAVGVLFSVGFSVSVWPRARTDDRF